MNIEKRKIRMLVELEEVREECEILIDRILSYRKDLLKVNTEKEANEFDETHNLEEGLKHICLF